MSYKSKKSGTLPEEERDEAFIRVTKALAEFADERNWRRPSGDSAGQPEWYPHDGHREPWKRAKAAMPGQTDGESEIESYAKSRTSNEVVLKYPWQNARDRLAAMAAYAALEIENGLLESVDVFQKERVDYEITFRFSFRSASDAIVFNEKYNLDG